MRSDLAERAADAATCPLCGAPNRCALEMQRATGAVQPPCWCTRTTFDPALLARIAPSDRRLRCVCAECAVAGRATQREC